MSVEWLIVYLSIEGHLGCFQLLAIENKAAINIRSELKYLFIWDKCSEAQCESCSCPCLAFLETTELNYLPEGIMASVPASIV